MNAIVERYHRDAEDYGRYWAPVLEATSRRLLDRLDDAVAHLGGAPTILDVGTGTGSVALAAAARWPGARVIASDGAAGMLDVVRYRAHAAGIHDTARLTFVEGLADRLPLPAASVDIVLSAFVLQLVPDRPAALREAFRLLRPGGTIGYVTWLDRDSRDTFRPMEEFDEAVLELDVDEPDEVPTRHAGDVASADAAARELRRAGFRRAVAREDVLDYQWTAEGYLEYKLAYDERALLDLLDADQQRRLTAEAGRRLAGLSPGDFRWHAPIVFATAVRPA